MKELHIKSFIGPLVDPVNRKASLVLYWKARFIPKRHDLSKRLLQSIPDRNFGLYKIWKRLRILKAHRNRNRKYRYEGRSRCSTPDTFLSLVRVISGFGMHRMTLRSQAVPVGECVILRRRCLDLRKRIVMWRVQKRHYSRYCWNN